VFTDSQPEPDFVIVRGGARTYLTRHPVAADVGLIIEVADSSLLRDQRDKTRIFARGGIPWYWIVNLVDHQIEVHSQPTGPIAVPVYQSLQTYRSGDAVPLILDGLTVATVAAADLLP
jgi:Uma2 family endonuclease